MGSVKATRSPSTGQGRKTRRRNCKPRSFDLKIKAVKLYLEDQIPATIVSEECGVAVATVHEWVKRFREEGEAGLKPKRYGHRTVNKAKRSQAQKKAIELKKENKAHGSKRISQILRRIFFLKASPETVRKTLHEEKLVEKPKRKPKRNPARPRFFERAKPNQMWQTDIFTFRLGGKNAYLIGFIDDYSRYIVGLGLYRSQTAEHVLEVFRTAAGEYNVPKEMLTDNGRQYTNWRGTTKFEKELQKDRIKHIKSSPHHPMTLGKIERFWKTIFTEFLGRSQFDSFEEARERLRTWVLYYNHKRPHQGINGLCPADRFYEINTALKKHIEENISDDVLETALRGRKVSPFYMVGRMGEQSVVIRAEKGKVRMLVDDEEKEAKELVYDVKESEEKDNKEDESGNGGEDRSEGSKDKEIAKESQLLQREAEVPGGALPVVGEAEASGDNQRAGSELDGTESVAEQGAISDAGGAYAGIEEGRGPGTGVGAEAGEDAGKDQQAAEEALEAGAAPGADTGECKGIIESDDLPGSGYALLTKEEARMVAEWLAEKRARKEEAGNHGPEERREPGATYQVDGSDPEGAHGANERHGRGEGDVRKSENVLQAGEESSGGDAGGAERAPLRAALSGNRWLDEDDGEGDSWDAEGATAV